MHTFEFIRPPDAAAAIAAAAKSKTARQGARGTPGSSPAGRRCWT